MIVVRVKRRRLTVSRKQEVNSDLPCQSDILLTFQTPQRPPSVNMWLLNDISLLPPLFPIRTIVIIPMATKGFCYLNVNIVFGYSWNGRCWLFVKFPAVSLSFNTEWKVICQRCIHNLFLLPPSDQWNCYVAVRKNPGDFQVVFTIWSLMWTKVVVQVNAMCCSVCQFPGFKYPIYISISISPLVSINRGKAHYDVLVLNTVRVN